MTRGGGFLIVLVLLAVPFVAAHPGETAAEHPCPDLNVLWAHAHEDDDGVRYFWMDTEERSPHADTGSPFSSSPDDGPFVLTLEPALEKSILLNTSNEVVVVVHGMAETSTPVFPGPAQGVFDEIQGIDEVPGEVKGVIGDVRDQSVQNVGSGPVTIRATLMAGTMLIGTGEASTTVTHTPPPALADEQFSVQIAFNPQVALVQPGLGNITLTLERVEPLAWQLGTVGAAEPSGEPTDPVDAALAGPSGQTRLTLPIEDHPTGPLCPGWELPPVEFTSDAPKNAERHPGQRLDFSVVAQNPARAAQNVTFSWSNASAGLSGEFLNVEDGKTITLDPGQGLSVQARITVSESAQTGTGSIQVAAIADGGAFDRTITVRVTPAPPPPEEAASEPDPSQDDETNETGNASVPLDDEAGGDSPGLGVAAVALALLAAVQVARRRRG